MVQPNSPSGSYSLAAASAIIVQTGSVLKHLPCSLTLQGHPDTIDSLPPAPGRTGPGNDGGSMEVGKSAIESRKKFLNDYVDKTMNVEQFILSNFKHLQSLKKTINRNSIPQTQLDSDSDQIIKDQEALIHCLEAERPFTSPVVTTLSNGAPYSPARGKLVEQYFRDILGIEPDILWYWKPNRSFFLTRAVFLMIHPRYKAEIDLLTSLLLYLGATVYHAGIPGSWDYFLGSHHFEGTVIFHPNMDCYWRIPRFYMVTGGKYLIFQIGCKKDMIHNVPMTYDFHPIIQNGTVVLITDEIFQFHVSIALEAVTRIVRMRSNGSAWRLAARPGLREWLPELANLCSKAQDLNIYGELITLLDGMSPLETDDEVFDGELPQYGLVWLSKDILPNYAEKYEVDRSAATFELVEWFAGWSALEFARHRRFMVLHPSPERPVWKREFHHVQFFVPDKVQKLMC